MNRSLVGALSALTATSIWGGMYVVSDAVLDVVPPATLVMMFFMHLKYDSKWYSLSLVLPLFMAALLAVVVLIASQSA